MGNVAGYRDAWIGAEMQKITRQKSSSKPRNETLVGLIDGEILFKITAIGR